MSDKGERTIELLEEILKWTKFQGWQNVKSILLATLETDTEKLVYKLSDGRSTTEIGKLTPISHMTVYNYWQKWAKLGLVEPSKKFKGRYEKIFPLEDFGIEVSKLGRK